MTRVTQQVNARCDTCDCTDDDGLSGTGGQLLCNACVWSELLSTRREVTRLRDALTAQALEWADRCSRAEESARATIASVRARAVHAEKERYEARRSAIANWIVTLDERIDPARQAYKVDAVHDWFDAEGDGLSAALSVYDAAKGGRDE